MIFGYGFDVNLFAVGADTRETLCASDGCLTAIPVFDRLQNDRGFLCDGGGVLYRVTTPGRFMERIVRAGHLWGNMTYILAKNADEPQDDIVNRNRN